MVMVKVGGGGGNGDDVSMDDDEVSEDNRSGLEEEEEEEEQQDLFQQDHVEVTDLLHLNRSVTPPPRPTPTDTLFGQYEE